MSLRANENILKELLHAPFLTVPQNTLQHVCLALSQFSKNLKHPIILHSKGKYITCSTLWDSVTDQTSSHNALLYWTTVGLTAEAGNYINSVTGVADFLWKLSALSHWACNRMRSCGTGKTTEALFELKIHVTTVIKKKPSVLE